MKLFWNLLLIVALAGGAGAVGFWMGHRSATATDPSAESGAGGDEKVDVVAPVQVTPIQQGKIERKIVAYGSVTASDVSVLSVPYESQVKRILVTPGQSLDGEMPVIEVEPSADTQLQILQAKGALEAAKKDLEQTRQRFNDHLATNAELLQSQGAVDVAQLKSDSLQKSGADGVHELKASGLVSKIDVQVGQVVPAGGALIETTASNKLVVRLGIEPTDAAALRVGDPVELHPISSGAAPISGKIKVVSLRINPDTRLVDLFVSLPAGTILPLDASMRGELVGASAEGLIVPRAALLPANDDGFTLFTVENGKAAGHKTVAGVQNDERVQVIDKDLAAGQSVVVQGNLELDDGMAVKIEAAPAPTTEPAASDAHASSTDAAGASAATQPSTEPGAREASK